MESSNDKTSKGGNWTGCLFYWNGEKTTQVPADKVLHFFRNRLQAENEIIKFAKIRKYNLWWIPGWFGNWHEYTLIQSTNYWWSFEKMSSGIHVQKSKNKEDVQCTFEGEPRNKDRPEGRSAIVSHGENILDVAKWIIMRNELGNPYHVTKRNCHYFASLLYEAIVRKEGRRLDNTV
ncbi:unnamed protein product [Caenorhabditis brenneri]